MYTNIDSSQCRKKEGIHLNSQGIW